MIDETSRRSVAFATALLVHAALFAVVARRSPVALTIVPTSVTLTFVEVAARTAGPGEPAPQLRVTAPAMPEMAPTPLPEPEIAPRPSDPVSEPRPPDFQPAPPVAEPEPAPVAAPKRSNPVAAKPSTAPPHPWAAPGDAASIGSGPSTTGTDSRASAPTWAPSARVRYEELLFSWMDRHKQYPLVAQRRGLEGAGSVRVRIGRDGRVLEHTVDKSTGEAMLDQAALDMVRRASPFPAVPVEYAGDAFEFVAPIQYRLR
ncbi:MAG: energy transducer TonB [Candidatus Binatia bacterium]